jgi:cysteine-rich repeat protein
MNHPMPLRAVLLLGLVGLVAACGPTAVAGDNANDSNSNANDTNSNSNANVNNAGPDCGNGVINQGEDCDGVDLGGIDCVALGYSWGDLACQWNCAFDETACSDSQPVCGNDILEATEQCDGPDLGGATCEGLGEGFTGGDLNCATGCLFDSAGCTTCGNGLVETPEVCDDGNTLDDLTCSADCQHLCTPGVGVCNGDTSTRCSWNGEDLVTEYCDPIQGMACDSQTGLCVGACSPIQLGSSYIGCDYFPTVTSNALLANKTLFTYSLAVSNTGSVAATVTVTQAANTIWTNTVAANSIQIIDLPWVVALSDVQFTNLATDGAYRLRSDQPVTVYQYNPLQYTLSGQFTYTNDAALLLPVNTWTGNYRVVSRWPWSGYPGFYAITASEDNTTVVLTPSASGGAVDAGFGMNADGTGTVTLHAGDVLQVMANSVASSDLTGTLVTADKPVQVIGGHVCTNIPAGVVACDHLEEAIPPLEKLGQVYVVTAPLISASNTKAQFVRIIATTTNTSITYDPPQAGAPTSLANAGDWFEIGPTSADFKITADQPVMVAQYMQGRAASTEDAGDPAMTLAVAVFQYRLSYLFHAPTNYDANYVNITAPTGSTVTLDGAAVSGWSPIGTSGYDIVRAQLSNAGDGDHSITSSHPVGISVYGYGWATSYWYPGGLNLLDRAP